jgi:hypothetical protein
MQAHLGDEHLGIDGIVELDVAAEHDAGLAFEGRLLGQLDAFDEELVGADGDLLVAGEYHALGEERLRLEGDGVLGRDGQSAAGLEPERVGVAPGPRAAEPGIEGRGSRLEDGPHFVRTQGLVKNDVEILPVLAVHDHVEHRDRLGVGPRPELRERRGDGVLERIGRDRDQQQSQDDEDDVLGAPLAGEHGTEARRDPFPNRRGSVHGDQRLLLDRDSEG